MTRQIGTLKVGHSSRPEGATQISPGQRPGLETAIESERPERAPQIAHGTGTTDDGSGEPSYSSYRRTGLTLLEVILALAILGMALAAISQLISLGARAASESRELTRAQIIAESILAQLAADALPVETFERLQVPYEPNWVYSTLVEGTDQPGLVAVHVVVEQRLPTSEYPIRFVVTRWMVDPEVIAAGEETVIEPVGADL